jgi:hypothetical protein
MTPPVYTGYKMINDGAAIVSSSSFSTVLLQLSCEKIVKASHSGSAFAKSATFKQDLCIKRFYPHHLISQQLDWQLDPIKAFIVAGNWVKKESLSGNTRSNAPPRNDFHNHDQSMHDRQ